MWHMFFWLMLAIEYTYGVVYSIPCRFEQVTVKVRSQPGQKGQISKLLNFNTKYVFFSGAV